jgi:hypothetical protein
MPPWFHANVAGVVGTVMHGTAQLGAAAKRK